MSLPPVERESLLLYDLDPEVVAAAVVSCPAVAAMSGGPFGTAATYLPGRSVLGVRSGGDRLEVHVVLAHPASVHDAAAQIRRALLTVAVGRPVDIVVEDVALPGDEAARADLIGEAGGSPTVVGVGWPAQAAPPTPPAAGGTTGRLRALPEG